MLLRIALLLITIFVSGYAWGQADKIIRFSYQDKEYYGVLKGDTVKLIEGDIFEDESYEVTALEVSYNNINLLPPVNPSKIIAFGWTFREHAEEVGGETDIDEPLVFLKPPSCLIAHEDSIDYPEHLSDSVEFEGELAIIIGKKGRFIDEEDALDHVFGFSCFNDVTARDLVKSDPQLTRGKGFDTFGPMGPWIAIGVVYSDLRIVTRLNGEVKQNSKLSEMRFSIQYLISYISKVMTLNRGDVILTGTPGGTAPIKPGDEIEVEIEKVGVLRNYVK